MIKTKSDLLSVLNVEKDYLPKRKFFLPPQAHFVKSLRFLEFNLNHGGFRKVLAFLWWLQWRKWSQRSGISIPKNTCEGGLTLYHFGSIVVNPNTRIGRNCCIMNNVNIGTNGGSNAAPRIGNNVYIGPGAVIYGDIEIADGCYIGANSVVNKSCLEKDAILVGSPARVIKYDSEHWWVKNKLKRDE